MAKKTKKTAAKTSSVKATPADTTIKGATTVPRENVGAACQAAVSFEQASTVTAQATDDTRTMFTVTWS
jgi:hypothetical protein